MYYLRDNIPRLLKIYISGNLSSTDTHAYTNKLICFNIRVHKVNIFPGYLVSVNTKLRVRENTIVFRASVTLGYTAVRESTISRWTVMERDTSSSQSRMSEDAFLTTRDEEMRTSVRTCMCVHVRASACARKSENRGNNPSTGIDVASVLSLAGASATRAILHDGKVSSLVKGDVATLTSAAVDAREVRYREARKRRRYNLGKYGAPAAWISPSVSRRAGRILRSDVSLIRMDR